MGQIWVRTKNHPRAARLGGGSFLSIFQKKQCCLYKGYRQTSRMCWQYPTKRQEKTPGNKTWGLWLRGQDLNLRSRLPPRSARSLRATGTHSPFGL